VLEFVASVANKFPKKVIKKQAKRKWIFFAFITDYQSVRLLTFLGELFGNFCKGFYLKFSIFDTPIESYRKNFPCPFEHFFVTLKLL
jgi:hypothetical protein